MLGRNQDLAIPAIARDEQEVRKQFLRTRRNGEIDFVGSNHVGDLLGRALVQVEADARVSLAKLSDHVG